MTHEPTPVAEFVNRIRDTLDGSGRHTWRFLAIQPDIVGVELIHTRHELYITRSDNRFRVECCNPQVAHWVAARLNGLRRDDSGRMVGRVGS